MCFPSFDDQASLFFTQRLLGYIGRLDAKSQITEWSFGSDFFSRTISFSSVEPSSLANKGPTSLANSLLGKTVLKSG